MDQLSIIFFPIPVLHTGVFLTVMRSLSQYWLGHFWVHVWVATWFQENLVTRTHPYSFLFRGGPGKCLKDFDWQLTHPLSLNQVFFVEARCQFFYQDGCHSCRCHFYHGYEIIVFILLLFWSVVYSVTVLHGLLQGLYFVDAPLDRATYNNDN